MSDLKFAPARYHRRTSRERGLPSTFTTNDWLNACAHFGYKCAVCGKNHATDADHWVPLASPECPGTIPTNMIPLCEHCNSSKNDSNPTEWVKANFSYKVAQRILRNVERYFLSLEIGAE